MTNLSDTIRVGGRFGDLEIREEIGRGAFGVVYRAWDLKLERDVALKVLAVSGSTRELERERRKFLDEARVLAGFNHPHIIVLHGLHEEPGGDTVLELEYLGGGTLETRLADGVRLPETAVRHLARELADALGAAHAQGVLHGDVKPANVLYARDGRSKLTDFGLARRFGANQPDASVRGIGGTAQYMAPEVIEGLAYERASDFWSLGVVLFRALAGRLPFGGTSLPALFNAILNQPAPALDAGVSPELRALVERCLVKRAKDRSSEAQELLALLKEEPGRRTAPVLAPPPPAGPPLVAREAERARAQRVLDELAAGRGSTLLLTGPTGIGKSALLRAALDAARARGMVAVQATISPVEGILRALARALGREPPSDASAGWETAESTPVAVQRHIEALAAAGPVLLALEDVHHAEREELQALAGLIRRLRTQPVAWIVVERTPDLGSSGLAHVRSSPLLDMEGVERCDLGALPSEALFRILEAAGGERIDGPVADGLVRRSGGNPLFALQLLQHYKETGVIRRDGARWVAAGGTSAPPAPPALRDVVARRLQALPDTLRELLEVAAVDGLDFDGEAVSSVLERPVLAVLRELQQAYRTHALVVPDAHGFRFGHPLLQEVLYADVAPDFRRAIHRRLAEHLGARPAIDPERLGTHWEQSGERARAAPWLLRAAQRAAVRMENLRAIDLAARAGVGPEHIPDEILREHADALIQVATAFSDAGRHEEREAYVARLLEYARRVGDERLGLRVMLHSAHARFLGRGLQPGDEAAVREAAAHLPPGLERGRARYLLGVIAKYGDRSDEAEQHLRAANADFVAENALGWHGSALDQLGSVLLRRGRAEEAETLYAQAAEACRAAGRASNAAGSDVNRAVAMVESGRMDQAEALMLQSIHRLELDGTVNVAAHARVVLADVRYALGRTADAWTTLEEALGILRKTAFRPGTISALCLRARLGLARGDLESALRDAEEGGRAAQEQGDPAEAAEALGLSAQGAALCGDVARATQLAREALATLGPSPVPGSAATLTLSLLESLLLGLPPEALEALATTPWFASARAGSGTLAVASEALASLAMRASPQETAARLEAAAASIRARPPGLCRALWRVLADHLEAEGALRRGGAEAPDRLESAARSSAALGHVWLEARARRAHGTGAAPPALRAAIGRVHDAHLKSALESRWLATAPGRPPAGGSPAPR